MSGPEWLLAISMLVATPGTPYPEITADEWPALQQALHKVAIDWQIMDVREIKFLLTRREDLTEDLNLLRKRCQDLRDAPLISDSMRFPDRTVINDMLSFNRGFRKYLEMKRTTEPDRASHFNMIIKETDRLYHVWDAIRDARCEFYYITVRRQAMKRLRDLVGSEDYYLGNFPPYVPTWRFQEVP